jgi:hypothetical protein
VLQNRLAIVLALTIFAIVIVGWIVQLGGSYKAGARMVRTGSLLRSPRRICSKAGAETSINRFKKIDRWNVHDPSLRHRFLEFDRSREVLGHLRVLGVEDNNDLALIAVGGMVDARIAETCGLLHSACLLKIGRHWP